MKWLGLVPIIRERQRWHRLRAGMGYFEVSLYVTAWDKTLRVVVYRKPVHHETKKNFQLDLFDPDNGYYEYSAVTTNLELGAPVLWDFMAGRGAQEKNFGSTKRQLGVGVGAARLYLSKPASPQ